MKTASDMWFLSAELIFKEVVKQNTYEKLSLDLINTLTVRQ